MPSISKKLGYKVICDFRVQDINLGGQGAPLVPVGEEYLFSDYNSFINLGGFANITKTIKNKIIAYDICPINIVFNSLCNKIELEYDNNGDVAASGKINKALYDELQLLKFYSLPYPKSLSAEWVNEFIEPQHHGSNVAKKQEVSELFLQVRRHLLHREMAVKHCQLKRSMMENLFRKVVEKGGAVTQNEV